MSASVVSCVFVQPRTPALSNTRLQTVVTKLSTKEQQRRGGQKTVNIGICRHRLQSTRTPGTKVRPLVMKTLGGDTAVRGHWSS